MSHHPEHVWSAATTERETNAAGEPQYVLVKRCLAPGCGASEKISGGVVETPSGFHYTKYLASGSEPDD